MLLGCNDKETLANIRTCQWYKRKNEMTSVSQACKDFLIEKLLARIPRCVVVYLSWEMKAPE